MTASACPTISKPDKHCSSSSQKTHKLSIVGNTIISPIAFYSKKYQSLKDLRDGARIAIPNDPGNQTRASRKSVSTTSIPA